MTVCILEKRKYLFELSTLIKRKDIRSIRKWCSKNHLHIYKDASGHFVNENEFALVYNLPIISRLKHIHGDDWHEYYTAYQNRELHTFFEISSTGTGKKSIYKPKGKLTSRFFDGSQK